MRFDKERLLEAGMGDPEFTRELADMMLTDSSERLQKLRAAVEAEQWEAAGREAHSLKGAALNVGANDLARLCAEVEDHLRILQNTVGSAAIDAITAEFQAVSAEIRNTADTL